MKVDILVASNQPANWLDIVTGECRSYPIHLVKINKEDLVLDIGANVGGFYRAWRFISDNWEMVEPSTYNCEQIKTNTPITPIQRAVYHTSDDILQLQNYYNDGGDTLSGNFGTTQYLNTDNNHGWRGEYEEVSTISFDDLVKGREVGLLKIDCEGAEYPFLMNAELSTIGYIVGEFHNFLGKQKQDLLFSHINKTHTEIYTDGNGVDSHFVKLWQRKN